MVEKISVGFGQEVYRRYKKEGLIVLHGSHALHDEVHEEGDVSRGKKKKYKKVNCGGNGEKRERWESSMGVRKEG